MNSTHRLKLFKPVMTTAAQNFKDRQENEQSRTGLKLRDSYLQFAKDILDTANKLDSVEDMVAFEQSLQKLDLLKAKPGADRNSIISAQKNYAQFSATIEQMRKTPDAYFGFVVGHKDTGGDPRKIVKGNSLDFITGNITRMQNRKQFASESESKVWDARIAMAKKTGEMFKALHRSLAANFERKRRIRAEDETKQ